MADGEVCSHGRCRLLHPNRWSSARLSYRPGSPPTLRWAFALPLIVRSLSPPELRPRIDKKSDFYQGQLFQQHGTGKDIINKEEALDWVFVDYIDFAKQSESSTISDEPLSRIEASMKNQYLLQLLQ
ncbi:hypothetical protein C4D60_Mb10t04870 [Musa balbisiana]|uniref:Uncharacterized protein n=1 Tax=Musa balbisiana TaxID=52838 RepID=A0A4S8IUS2_MUSBA|nr:hypothetical protein C4D60_Mb10t04870 [Musa balbisiana]